MPFIIARKIPKVTHIGQFESVSERLKPGYEGPGFVVSDDPAGLRQATGMNGPEVILACSTAEWVDPLCFEDKDHQELQYWMQHEKNRYMTPVTTYQVMVEDLDAEDLVERTFLDFAEACKAVRRSEEEERAAAAQSWGAVEAVEGFMLTRRAIKRLGGNWPDPLRWFDAAVLLYTREVVMVKRPFVVGIWWNEPASRADGTAPHGVVFAEALCDFTVRDEDDEDVPFIEAFPQVEIPERKVLL